MKKFILNITVFTSIMLIFPIGLNIWSLRLLYHDKYKNIVAGSEVYYSIYKSKQKKKSKKLLLGDSVGGQLFPANTNTDTINSLACNQAITMVGYYILLNNYLNSGNQVDTVYMIVAPLYLGNNLNQVYAYHYFLKPFYIDEYLPLFTATVKKQINKIPYVNFCRLPYILTSNWAPDFVSKDDINYTFLSPVSIEYLNKIKELGVKYKFKLIVFPTPTAFSQKAVIEKMNKNEIVKNNLSNEFKNYFENIIYLDDSNFMDGLHLKKPQKYIEYYKNKLMK